VIVARAAAATAGANTAPADLAVVVALALPEFQKLDTARTSALLDVVCTLNPWVNRRVIRSGGEKVDGVRERTTEAVRYDVAAGQPILVPDMSYLEAHAAKGRSRE
jgi:hypothetical protein